jgi:hypothetical protein
MTREEFLKYYLEPITFENIDQALEFLNEWGFTNIRLFARRAKETGRSDLTDLAKEFVIAYIKKIIPDADNFIEFASFPHMSLKTTSSQFVRFLIDNGVTWDIIEKDAVLKRTMEVLSVKEVHFKVFQKEKIRAFKITEDKHERPDRNR